ncbi:MAG TPA: hypothetical protein VNS32_23035 [Flavisolibacter sp.]|nr:hypothetical protein [Flavisolibacter sp.]
MESKKKGNNKVIRSEISQDFAQELYTVLLQYQKKYPLTEQKKKGLYIYVADFFKFKNDTILLLFQSPEGVRSSKDQIVLGVYEDEVLHRTAIRDAKQFYSKKLIKRILIDSLSLLHFKPDINKSYPENFPPVYYYKVVNDQLVLNKIDTVWSTW